MVESGLIPPAAAGAPWDIVFLDRDGTLNERVDGYVGDPDDLIMLPGAAAAVADLNRAGCFLSGCLWFERMTGRSVIGNSFKPLNMEDETADFLRGVAHAVAQEP